MDSRRKLEHAIEICYRRICRQRLPRAYSAALRTLEPLPLEPVSYRVLPLARHAPESTAARALLETVTDVAALLGRCGVNTPEPRFDPLA